MCNTPKVIKFITISKKGISFKFLLYKHVSNFRFIHQKRFSIFTTSKQ